tara:strand:+ start:74 stop:394 length:321 start_codon:yes stop_codon:yes gene_type:complete
MLTMLRIGMVGITVIELFMSFVGLIMAFSCTPQILKVIERKSSEDVSILTTQMLIFGEVCWIGYSFHMESLSIFIYGFLSVILLSIQLGVILAYREPKGMVEEKEC